MIFDANPIKKSSINTLLLSVLLVVALIVRPCCTADAAPSEAAMQFPWAKPPSQSTSNPPSQAQCRCFPGSACWPDLDTWRHFNDTLGGRLIATSPIASPCHDDAFAPYNESQCIALQSAWLEPQIHYQSSSSVMAPYFANQSCDPFLPRSSQCVVGTYVSYAVNVSDYTHVVRTIWFTTYHNIRLVIRNTGHDYNGKSTGAGAVGVWLHNLKDITFADYSSTNYTGKAITTGAGVQAFEAYQAANTQRLAVVGPECSTVGVSGGYPQGGGHSSLASKYGLAADQVLEWQVVDGLGRYMKASPTENPDMYWALSGGGGGTYGVVMSVTSKAHPDVLVSGANLSFTSQSTTIDNFYHAVSTFLTTQPSIVDAGAVAVWQLSNESFSISPLLAVGTTSDELRVLLRPLTQELDTLHIPYESVFRQFNGFYPAYQAMQLQVQVGTGQGASRFIPRSLVQENVTALTDAYRHIAHRGGSIVGTSLNVSRQVTGSVYNAVIPAWRDTLIETEVVIPITTRTSLEQMRKEQDILVDDFIARLAALTPHGHGYLNEGSFRQPDFQSVYYGSNYPRLREIKDKYDPNHLFYAVTGVGSEYWEQQADGRLCKAQVDNT